MSNSKEPKPTRSEELVPTGFYRAKKRAENYLNDPEKAADLLAKARQKAAQKQGALAGVWEDLQTLFRLLRTWLTGNYAGASWQTMLLVITAILYFVMPFDVIPDFIIALGFFDDAAIIIYIVSNIKEELQAFIEWEQLIGESKSSDEELSGMVETDPDRP